MTTTITPYICVKDAAKAIQFYEKAFGAVVTMRLDAPDGKVGHAEMRIGNAAFYLSDEHPDIGWRSPQSIGGSPCMMHVAVDDADASGARAVAAGATVVRPVEDQFYGERGGQLLDPFGHTWWLGMKTEELSNEEVTRRAQKL
jgi:PhnB protein